MVNDGDSDEDYKPQLLHRKTEEDEEIVEENLITKKGTDLTSGTPPAADSALQ